MPALAYLIGKDQLTRPAVAQAIEAGRAIVTLERADQALLLVRGLTPRQHQRLAQLPGVQPIRRRRLSRRADADTLRDWINVARGRTAGEVNREARMIAQALTEPED